MAALHGGLAARRQARRRLAAAGSAADAFPGNNLGKLEFTPEAGVPVGRPADDRRSSRKKSDLIVVRVTDETVPDAGKKRYALSLSIHGIERAGVEGGTRAMEDLVTAAHDRRWRQAGRARRRSSPARRPSRDVLQEDDHLLHLSEPGRLAARLGHRGRRLLPALQRQRRRREPRLAGHRLLVPALQRPVRAREPRARRRSSTTSKSRPAAQFAAGDDLHGQPFADALSYTLLPHGSHDFAKDLRIRETAKTIHRASEKALLWSPIVQPNDAPQGGGAPCAPTAPSGDGVRADLRPDLGHGLRHDQLHDDGRARRLVRLVGRAGRGRHRQRDVVLAPRQEHRLRPAHRAAARGRQQGADLRPPGGDRSTPADGDVRRARAQGLRAEPAAQARTTKAVQAGPPPGTVAQDDIVGRHGTVRRRRQHRVPVRGAAHEATAGRRRASSTAACASTSPTQNVAGHRRAAWRR